VLFSGVISGKLFVTFSTLKGLKRCRATNGHYSEADEKYDLLNFFAKSKSDVENELKTGRERVCDLKHLHLFHFPFGLNFVESI
jgi:hypothetical protein